MSYRDAKSSAMDESMVVVGFNNANTVLESAGVRRGDVVIAVRNVSVVGLSYQQAIEEIKGAVTSGGQVSVTFVSACAFVLRISDTTVSISALYAWSYTLNIYSKYL
jgi:C-terminal processing protease CtpA/Prc